MRPVLMDQARRETPAMEGGGAMKDHATKEKMMAETAMAMR